VFGHLSRVGASQSRGFSGPKWAPESASGGEHSHAFSIDRSVAVALKREGGRATFGLRGITLRTAGCSCSGRHRSRSSAGPVSTAALSEPVGCGRGTVRYQVAARRSSLDLRQ
jgi:hypothetical protein